MSYSYAQEKPRLFTEGGQVMFLKIRDTAERLIKDSGAVLSGKLMNGVTGDCWQMLACMDRLVELGELVEVPNPTSSWGQNRLFVKPI